jgi:hypothetical protein
MITTQFEVSGIKFRFEQFTKAQVARGDRLTLKLEPTNQFDPNAIAVYKGDVQIGYVPRSHTKHIRDDLKARPEDIGCTVDAAWRAGCWVVVNIKDDNEQTAK